VKPPLNPFIEDGGVIPSDKLYLDVDTAKVDWAALNAKPSSRMTINLEGKSGMYRQELMILELLSNINAGNWERPLYYATTVGHDTHLNMTPNFSLSGLTYRVTPGQPLNGGVNTDVMFDNMINKFEWGGFDNPKVYLDENNRRMFSQMRNMFALLIEALIDKGENEKALIALDKSLTVLPSASMPFGYESVSYAEAYFRLGEIEKANAIVEEIENRIYLNLDWYDRLSPQQMANNASNILHYNLGVLIRTTMLYQDYDQVKYAAHVDDLLSRTQFYFSQGLGQLANTVLKEVTDGSIRGYYTAGEDTSKRAVEEEAMQKSMQLMQQYSPELMQHYENSGQQ
jgi:tetratricopeptide (TPR) repeat protein